MQCQPLVVAVDSLKPQGLQHERPSQSAPTITHLFRVDSEGTFVLAVGTERHPNLFVRILMERTQNGAALAAIELDVLQLREDTRSTGHHSLDANELIEMRPAKVAEFANVGVVGDANVNFRVNTVVCWVVKCDNLKRDSVENREHGSWATRKEVGQVLVCINEMKEGDFKRFSVSLKIIKVDE